MIESGFYYTGYGDRVTCFHCGITLRNWEHADNVDMEHKKHSPECKYLLMFKRIWKKLWWRKNLLDKFIVNVVIGCYCNQKLYLLEHIFRFNIKTGFDIINS